MSTFVKRVKEWGKDPDTATSLKKSATIAAISGTFCIVGGILFGPIGIGVGAITLGVSTYVIERNDFNSAGYSLGLFLNNSSPQE